MFSIRNLHKARLMAIIIGAGMLWGCQLTQKPGASHEISTASIPTDQAMDKRQWDASLSNYPNDAVWACPHYQPLEMKPEPYKLNAVAETVLFLGNLGYLPVGIFIQYPWSWEASKSLALPPSYTLMPPLPEGAEGMPTIYPSN